MKENKSEKDLEPHLQKNEETLEPYEIKGLKPQNTSFFIKIFESFFRLDICIKFSYVLLILHVFCVVLLLLDISTVVDSDILFMFFEEFVFVGVYSYPLSLFFLIVSLIKLHKSQSKIILLIIHIVVLITEIIYVPISLFFALVSACEGFY